MDSTYSYSGSLASFNTNISNSLLVSNSTAGFLRNIYIQNQLVTTEHWLCVIPGTTPAVFGTTVPLLAFWNPGLANYALQLDETFFKDLRPNVGFTIFRSSDPMLATQLAAPLSQPSYVRVSIGPSFY